MSTRIITRQWKVDDVLTSVTTAKLSDPTGTYGVKRDDTDAVVVADGIAMTESSTGIYTYSFTEPADELAYTAYVEIVYDGATHYFEHDLVVASFEDTEIGLTFMEIKQAIGYEHGYWNKNDGWKIVSADQPADLDAIIKGGLRRFYLPAPQPPNTTGHQWSFLRPLSTLTLAASTSLYDLPSDFGGMSGPLNFAPDSSVLYSPIKIMPEREVQQKLAMNTSAGRPIIAAIRPKVASYSTGTRYEILVYPTSDDAYSVQYRYRVGLQMLSGDSSVPPGGNEHAGTILEACLAEAEIVIKGEEGPHSRRFPEMLAASISQDRVLNCPDTLGFDREQDGVLSFENWYGSNDAVTYNDVSY